MAADGIIGESHLMVVPRLYRGESERLLAMQHAPSCNRSLSDGYMTVSASEGGAAGSSRVRHAQVRASRLVT